MAAATIRARWVNTIAELQSLSPPQEDNFPVASLGYWQAGDVGGGVLRYDRNSTTSANYGITFRPDTVTASQPGRWKRVVDGHYQARWFGVKWDGSTDDIVRLQDAVNILANEGGGILELPRGVSGELGDDLYLYYDATNNPDFPSTTGYGGRVMLHGEGPGNYANNVGVPLDIGTRMVFGSNFGLKATPAGDASGGMTSLRDFAIHGSTTGVLVDFNFGNQLWNLDRLFIYNDAAGTALRIRDSYVGGLRNIFIVGNSAGTGFVWDGTELGGGNVEMLNVTCREFDIGWDMGRAYDGDLSHFSNLTLINTQAAHCRIGMRLRWGIASLVSINHWDEDSDFLADATSRAVVITDSAGHRNMTATPPQGGGIKFIGGKFARANTASGFAQVQLGTTGGTDEANAAGPVVFEDTLFDQVNTNTFAIRRHNATLNGPLTIDGVIAHDNGGKLIAIDDAEQAAPIYIKRPPVTGMGKNEWVTDTSGTDKQPRLWTAFAANDATPSVADRYQWFTANSNPTTITALDNGIAGQEVVIKIADANTTVDFTGTTLKGNGGSDWTPGNGDFMRCTFDGTNWLCQITEI